MASKIKLGSRPKNFTRVVKFPLIEGGEGAIEITYKYRTRTEFGTFIDGLMEAAGKTERTPDDKFSMADLMERTKGSNASYIIDVVESWNLDEDLSKANVEQLADELPAAVNAIMETYRLACTEGRLGN